MHINLMKKNEGVQRDAEIMQGLPSVSKRRTGIRWILLVFGKIVAGFIAIAVIGLFALSYKIIFSAENIVQKDDTEKTPLYKQVHYLFGSGDKKLQGEQDDRINVALLGMGGPGHSSGIYLADTIIVASFKPTTGQVAMLSIPRDLVVEMNIPKKGNLGFRKINNANAFGRQFGYPGGGEKLTSDILEEVTGLPIHYFVRVDFEGFRKIVNTLGGISVNVQRSFTDKQFPDYNFSYQTIHFEAGVQKMNGEQALQFARSRKGNNGEGSDFSRAKRQQKILLAVKEKFFSLQTLLNPKRINNILNDLGDHVSTNLEVWEMLKAIELVKVSDTHNIITKVIDNQEQGLLYSDRTEDGAYVLIPKAGLGNYSEIQRLARNIFDERTTVNEEARIEIRNGTKKIGLAQKTAEKLTTLGLSVMSVGNARTQTQNTKTVIYDFSRGAKKDTLELLRDVFQANIAEGIPQYLDKNETIDFLIILGEDIKNVTQAL